MSKKAKAEEDSQALEVRPDASIATIESMMQEDAGQGFENVTARHQQIPTLKVIQALSPEIQEGDAKYIEGAKPGMFVNSLSGKLYDGKEGVRVLHCHFEPHFVEYVPRKKGGGFVRKSPTEEAAYALREDPENEIQETWQHYLLLDDPEDGLIPILFSSSVTKLTPSRRWLSLMTHRKEKLSNGSSIVPASYYRFYTLTTIPQKNRAGQPYFNYGYADAEKVDDPQVIIACREFRQAIMKGDLKIADEVQVTQKPAPAQDGPNTDY